MKYSTLIKGKGLILVTGKKGSGKSHFVTKVISEIKKDFPDHNLFADITELSIDGVLPSPEDWRDAPSNSTIVYDEAQLLEWADNSSTKISSDERVRDMTLIRKQNKNIVLISQDPSFIHSALRKLVDYHYHLSHPFKDGKPKVFYFHGAITTIDDKGHYQKEAIETFIHHLDKETSNLYKSIDDEAVHDQVKKIPKKIIYSMIGIILAILVAIPLGIYGVKTVHSFIYGDKNESDTTAIDTVDEVKQNFEKATDFGNNINDSLSSPEDYKNAELLKLEKKYLDEYTAEVANYDTVRPASIMSMNGKCKAYNKFGDGLNITQSKCFDMLENPETIPKSRNLDKFDSQNIEQNNNMENNNTLI